MSTKITLEALEVLDAIAKKGTFAAAAASLYKVPSAVTYTMQKLEEELGVVVFRKQGRTSVLTPAGKVLLNEGRELLDAAEKLVETTRRAEKGWETVIHIAIDSVLQITDIYPYIQDLYSYAPNIEVNIHSEVLGGTVEAITDGRVDLVLGAMPFPNSAPGIQVEKISTVNWVFAVAKNHPLTKLNEQLTQEHIQQYRMVLVRDTSRHLPPISHRLFSKSSVLRVATMQQKIIAQLQGLGVGFLPEYRISSLLKSGELVSIPITTKLQSVGLHMAWRRANKGKALRWLVNKIRLQPGRLFFSENQSSE